MKAVGACPACGEEHGLSSAGRLLAHPRPASFGSRCAGSGRKPAEGTRHERPETHAEWKKPPRRLRRSPTREFALSPDLDERLDELPAGQRSAVVRAALRDWFGLPQPEDAPERPAAAAHKA